jgi:hypothetical protein
VRSLFIVVSLLIGSFAGCSSAQPRPDKLGTIATPTPTSESVSTNKLTATQAKNHVGKNATVCGVVAIAIYARNTHRQPTFICLDQYYPHQNFTAVIWGEDRSKFGTPETTLNGKEICVSGVIEEYQGKPRIILRRKEQLIEK